MLTNETNKSGNESSSNRPRLIIEKITVENFKSYAGSQTIGPLHPSFTAIVGPNGSGKSNVIDALMFVLGYRARRMRQGKLADLIYSGGSGGSAAIASSCLVNVHFAIHNAGDDYTTGNNDNNLTRPPFVIGRRAFANNKSVYEINGNSCTFPQIKQLLESHGMDLDHKRFLILQGEVESIAMMPPKSTGANEEGLLEYLEDIIGSNQYIEKIEESSKQLEQLSDEYTALFARTRIAKGELDGLREERGEAIAFINNENKLTQSQNQWAQATIWQANKKLKSEGTKVVEIEKDLSDQRIQHQEEIARLQTQRGQLGAQSTELKKKQLALQAHQRQLTALERKDCQLQEQKKSLKAKLIQKQSQSSRETKEIQQLEGMLADTCARIKRIQVELQDNQSLLLQEEQALNNLASSLKGVSGQWQSKLAALQSSLVPHQEQIAQLEQQINALQSHQQTENAKLASILEKQNTLEKHHATANLKVTQTMHKLEQWQVNQQNITETINEKRVESAEITREIEATTQECQMLQDCLDEVNDTIHAATDSSARLSPTLSSLMQESREGRIKGIHGRLGDLGTIDEAYSVAISTACTLLDHIVVDTTAVGQTCIEHLRKHGVGRANFIVLDKMRPVNAAPIANESSGGQSAKRLFDLITLKHDRYKAAMYFAVRETLVCANVQDARKLAYNPRRRERVVTLDGKLFEKSGTVSGGGRVKSGAMLLTASSNPNSSKQTNNSSTATTITPQQQNALKSKLALKQDHLSSLQQQLRTLHNTLKSLTRESASIQEECALAQDLLSSLQSELKLIKDQQLLQGQKQQTGANTKSTQEQKEEEINQLMQQINKIKSSQMQPIQQEIGEIEKEILSAGGLSYKVQKTKVDTLKEATTNAQSNLSRLETECVGIKAKMAMYGQGADADSNNAFQDEINAIDSAIQENTNTATSLHLSIRQQEQEVETMQANLEKLQSDLDQGQLSVGEFSRREYEQRCALEEAEEAIRDSQARLEQAQKLLQNLKLHAIPHSDDDQEDPTDQAPILVIYEEDDDLAELHANLPTIQQTISKLQTKIQASRPNLRVLEHWNAASKQHTLLSAHLQAAKEAKDNCKQTLDTLRQSRHNQFMSAFKQISMNLKRLFQRLTMGGNAELELVDTMDPFTEGIMFSVMPAKKSWRSIGNLSGGEKTLASLAFIFALHAFRPTPCYVLDEIDAALDHRNVGIIADFICGQCENAQFLVVSLRSDMFEVAKRLVGIYKTGNETKSVAIDPHLCC